MVDAAGTTKYTYYAVGLLNTEDGPWANDTVTNVYNNARMRSGLVLQQPTGTWTNGLTWDAFTNAPREIYLISYGADGRPGGHGSNGDIIAHLK